MWWMRVLLVVLGAAAGAALAALAALEPGWPPGDFGVGGGVTTVGLGALAGVALVVALFLFEIDARACRRAWPTHELIPAPDLVKLVEGAALARGEAVPRVWRLASPAPNLACFPAPDGRHLVVSSGAEAGFPPDELEALAALQFSLLLDPAARRVRRTVVVAARLMTWTARASALALVVVLVRAIAWAGLTVNLAVSLALAVIGLCAVVLRRLRWSWGLVSDGVAVDTTRHPEPLVRALRRLAGYNGEQVPVRRTYGAADPFWAAPVRQHVHVSTFVVNGRAQSSRSTEQVSDASLLLRAGIVQRVCIEGAPATMTSWRDASAVFERLGRFGAAEAGDAASPSPSAAAVDGTIDGIVVTTEGASGAPAAVPGAWPSPPEAESVLRRPWWPGPEAIAAYDAAATG
jgi:Zn-dependent protease with chaperone function